MNKTKIEWCDYTWNPITGCLNNCKYCYARKIYHRFKRSFEPTFHRERLAEVEKIKKPSRIFCGSVTDLYGLGVEHIWRSEVYNTMRKNPKHTFFVLTKKPENMIYQENIPENCWMGVSVTRKKELNKILQLKYSAKGKKFVSFEPVLGELDVWNLSSVDWIIIGGLTPRLAHNDEEIDTFLRRIDLMVQKPVFIKNNLKYWNPRKEFSK